MTYKVYAGIQKAHESPRDLEIRAISHITRQLVEADQPQSDPIDRIKALNGNMRLWSLLTQDLANPGNQLPDTIKANYIALGRFVIRASLSSLVKRDSLKTLIQINMDVLEALHQQQMACAA